MLIRDGAAFTCAGSDCDDEALHEVRSHRPEVIALARRSLLLAAAPDAVAKTVPDSARVRTFAHLHALVAQVEALKAQTGAQRVAEFLLELAPCRDKACEVTLPCDKVLIAGRLGMKPESLSRAFVRLRDQGVTIRQNLSQITDVVVLRDFVEEDPALAWTRT